MIRAVEALIAARIAWARREVIRVVREELPDAGIEEGLFNVTVTARGLVRRWIENERLMRLWRLW